MIFVMLGTNPYGFERLVKRVEDYASKTKTEVIIQLGYTRYKPENCRCFGFADPSVMKKYINAAEFIITHGGYGSIYEALECRKKIIAVPRLRAKNECKDSWDGQVELTMDLEEQGKLLAVYDAANLEKAIEKIPDFNPDFTIKNDIPGFILKAVQNYYRR